ncbi:MAG: class I SAM-dependent methyltransferase [Gammaproteobacteria bacterium]|nr:class I SAM-dependent methyltransferase [Gammaproteobacteria bacterium]
MVATLSQLYKPNHDEAARQRFIGVLKSFANGSLEEQLAERYEQVLKKNFELEVGHSPADRSEARSLFEADPLYQLWGSMVFTSQGLMWETVGSTCKRIKDLFEARAQRVTVNPRGTLSLNPSLEIPEPIASTEIHRQPGGYFASTGPNDLKTALIYFGTLELYRAAKGLTAHAPVGEPGIGRFVMQVAKRDFPNLRPLRILELGCGTGIDTIALKEAYPDAEVHGLDLSAPFVKFAHAWAEESGVILHFKQADAQATGYPDGYFDLIVSHILFHETWHNIAPKIFSEARRLLISGGVFLNADVPYQPARLTIPKQVTNDWQVRNNGEPFWTGFADTDVPSILRDAGFKDNEVFSYYEPLGIGYYYFFGGQKK